VLRAVNVNWNGNWNVNANPVDNPNRWNGGNQVFSRNSLFSPSLIGWEFCLKSLAPATDHASDFRELQGQFRIFGSMNKPVLPCELYEKFKNIMSGYGFSKSLNFSLRRKVYRNE
jgi:hypothetical protein